jgi:molecular chaperone Hsp33
MIPKPITDQALIEHLDSLEPDGITRFTILNARLRGFLAHGSRMVNEMRSSFGLGILETLILGQAYLAAGLYGATLKGKDRCALRYEGSGPALGFSVQADAEGSVRGYLLVDSIPLEAPLESFDTAPFLGPGTMSVTRIAEKGGHFTGTVGGLSGRVGEDLSRYFLESEQTRTLVSLGLRFNREGMAGGAAALLLQLMPGAGDDDLEELEERVREIDGPWFSLSEGGGREAWIKEAFGPFGPEVMGSQALRFHCPCGREGFLSYLKSLPDAEKREIRAQGRWPLELLCHNCASSYLFGEADLG